MLVLGKKNKAVEHRRPPDDYMLVQSHMPDANVTDLSWTALHINPSSLPVKQSVTAHEEGGELKAQQTCSYIVSARDLALSVRLSHAEMLLSVPAAALCMYLSSF